MSGVDNDIAARFAGRSEIFTDEAILSSEHSILKNNQLLFSMEKKIIIGNQSGFQWPSMQIWHCSIYNGTLSLKMYAWSEVWIRYQCFCWKLFESEKRRYLPHFRLGFQGYRCDSGIAIFAWRLTSNFTYNHLQTDIIKFYLGRGHIVWSQTRRTPDFNISGFCKIMKFLI